MNRIKMTFKKRIKTCRRSVFSGMVKGFLMVLAVLGIITATTISTKAYTEDSNGNLVSDNILKINDTSYTNHGVNFVCSDNKITLNGTAETTGPVWFTINIPSGTYTLQDFNDFTYDDGFRITLRQGYSNDKVSMYYDITNTYATFTSDVTMDILSITIVNGVTYNNVTLTPTLTNGSTPLNSYEPYGATYYSQENYNNALLDNYGIFRLCSSIQLTLTWTDRQQVDTYEWDSILSLINDKSYVNCINGVFSYGNQALSRDYLNGTYNATAMWQFNFEGIYPLVKQYPYMLGTGYVLRYQIIDNNGSLFAYDSFPNDDSYVDLTQYQNKQIGYIQLYTGPVGAGSQVDTTSLYFDNSYDVAYTRGYEDGKTKGYNEGVDYGESTGYQNGKNDGYELGYNRGVEDGEASDFATNGFKTLIGSIFNYPINMIRSVFNFEFMGINIATLVTFIISIVIVIFIVHKFKK